MSPLKEFTVSTARPLPVILMADVSGSMEEHGRIDALNAAVTEMLDTFQREDTHRAELQVAIVTFGQGGARLHQPLLPVTESRWEPMKAAGRTPLGGALELVTAMLEDRAQVPGRAWRPTIVLASDGDPTDVWEPPLQRLLASERASKASRFALGIGAAARKDVLQAFLADPGARVHEAHEVREIRRFFRWVTLTVMTRSRSVNPNVLTVAPPTDLEALDI